MACYDVSGKSSRSSMTSSQEPGPVFTTGSLIVNVITFILVFVGTALCYALGFSVYESGFFCDDDTIRFPYKPDTVSTTSLFLATLGPALITIIVTEAVRFWRVYFTCADNGLDTDSKDTKSWKTLLTLIGLQVALLLFGFALTGTVTEMFKLAMGRLRPHFLDVCQLKPGSYNCSQNLGYVTEYICTQTDSSLLKDARKSFLSGHASISFYFLIFITTYVGLSIPRSYALPKATIQAMSILLACYIAVSRVTDNKHHPTDVIAGGLLGTVFGFVTGRHMIILTRYRKPEETSNTPLQQVKTA